MMKEDWQSFDRRHGHSSFSVSFDILGPIRRWRERRRAEKLRQLIAHQEAYAMAVKAEEHRKAEAVQRVKRNIEHELRAMKE